jgi:hypothetical protein
MINEERFVRYDYVVPSGDPEEVDLGLDVAKRVFNSVGVGAMKTTDDTGRSFFIFPDSRKSVGYLSAMLFRLAGVPSRVSAERGDYALIDDVLQRFGGKFCIDCDPVSVYRRVEAA